MKKPAHSRLQSALALGVFGGAVTTAARTAASARPGAWYFQLRKPAFTPPDRVFGRVWSVLYPLIAISGWRVWKARRSPARTTALALWAVQLGLNAAWSWLFFKRRKPAVALVDLVGLEAAISGYIIEARKVDRAAAWMMVPYLGWVTFAGILNEEIVRRNPKP